MARNMPGKRGRRGVETSKIMDIQSVYRLCKEGIKFLEKKQ
jgi:hypothetical protein